MKRLRYLSIIAAAILMDGAVIAAQEMAEWEFNGQAVFYYQTVDGYGAGSLFDQGPGSATSGWAKAASGIQIGGFNNNLAGGFGVGFQLSAIPALGLHHRVISGLVQDCDGSAKASTCGALSQAYLTYGYGDTSLKVGRQELPKSLSPFAYSEGWNVFKNTFNAGLLVNSSIENTTLVYALVTSRNNSVGNLNDFHDFYESSGAHMVTAQNTSISGLTLTGSYYFVPDATAAGSARAMWVDALYAASAVSFGFQGGEIGGNAVPNGTSALGAKITGELGSINASLAYSTTGDGPLNIANLAGAGVKTPLYTQGVLNQNVIKRDSNTFKLTLSRNALGGAFTLAGMNSSLGETALPSVFGMGVGGAGTYQEYELIYQRGIGENTRMFTTFIYQKDDRQSRTSQNFARIWFRYSI